MLDDDDSSFTYRIFLQGLQYGQTMFVLYGADGRRWTANKEKEYPLKGEAHYYTRLVKQYVLRGRWAGTSLAMVDHGVNQTLCSVDLAHSHYLTIFTA